MAAASSATSTNEREIAATRVFDAPRELVWRMWTDPLHIIHWWGPNGFTCPVAVMDVRVGGRSLVCMSAPDWGFPALYSTWAYTLVDAPRRLEVEIDRSGVLADRQ